ncbi:hypothetical protein EDC01DRAFT_746630 [Geopyxis carbonaria]|nr:hypothetical protein EDC01DRAFT_746630 [Geopyxis carbonaria]
MARGLLALVAALSLLDTGYAKAIATPLSIATSGPVPSDGPAALVPRFSPGNLFQAAEVPGLFVPINTALSQVLKEDPRDNKTHMSFDNDSYGARNEKRELAPRDIPTHLPTMQDWWFMSGPAFVHNYTELFTGSEDYRKLGFTETLVTCLMPNRTDEQVCEEVQLRFPGPGGAHLAEMTWHQIGLFTKLVKRIQDNIEPAFRAAGEHLDATTLGPKWWKRLDFEQRSVQLSTLVQRTLQAIFLTAAPWPDPRLWLQQPYLLHQQAFDLQEYLQHAHPDPGAVSLSPNRWDQVLGTTVLGEHRIDGLRCTSDVELPMKKDTDCGLGLESMGHIVDRAEYDAASRAAWDALNDYITKIAHGAVHHGSDYQHEHRMAIVFPAIARRVTAALAGDVDRIRDGSLPAGDRDEYANVNGDHDDHTPMLAPLIAFGNLFAAEDAVKSVESQFQYALMQRASMIGLNSALTQRKSFWVTCTNDFRHDSAPITDRNPLDACEWDNHGHPHLKTCLVGQGPVEACYLFGWDYNKEFLGYPSDANTWPRVLGVSGTDVIKASVGAYDQLLSSFGVSIRDVPSAHEPPLAAGALGMPVPASFTLPVCFSRYNLNQPHHADPNPYSFPCYCGAWGRDTPSMWNQILPPPPKNSDNVRQNCAHSIERAIADPLEQFAAMCRIQAQPYQTLFTQGWKNTQHRDCDVALHFLEAHAAHGPEDLGTRDKTVLNCRLFEKADKKGCEVYKQDWEDWTRQWERDGKPAARVVGWGPGEGWVRGPAGEERERWEEGEPGRKEAEVRRDYRELFVLKPGMTGKPKGRVLEAPARGPWWAGVKVHHGDGG